MDLRAERRERIVGYLQRRRIQLEPELRHRLADTHLERVTFEARERSDGTKENEEPSWFGDQLRFLEYLREQASRAEKKPLLVLGDSGLGKTWLLLRTFDALSEEWQWGECIPFLIFLHGRTLTLDTKGEEILSRLSIEDRKHITKFIKADPLENFRGEVFAGTGLTETDIVGLPVVLLMDGLNEMPPEGQSNLFYALKTAFPHALWVISGQPQVVDGVDEIKKNKTDAGWDFLLVQPILKRGRLEAYLKVLLPEETDWKAVTNYLEKLSPGIWRNPRYLEKICENVKAHPQNSDRWPLELGEIFDQAVGEMLQRYLRESKADESVFPERISLQKLLLGCLGIYEMLSGGIPLSWDVHGGERSVWVWLKGFQEAGILPVETWKVEVTALRNRGPWGFAKSQHTVFDHETTRDFAVAFLIVHLVRKWTPGRNHGFNEWLELALVMHPELGKSLRIIMDLTDQDLKVRDSFLSFLSPYYLSPHAAYHPYVKGELLFRLDDEYLIDTETIKTLAPLAVDRDVRTAFLRQLPSSKGDVRRALSRSLHAIAEDPEVKAAAIELLGDGGTNCWIRDCAVSILKQTVGEYQVRTALLAKVDSRDSRVSAAAIKALSPVVGEPEVRRKLIHQIEDKRWSVRCAAIGAISSTAKLPEDQAMLLGWLHDESTEVRSLAVDALKRAVGEPLVQQALIDKLDDDSREVCEKVVSALRLVAKGRSVKSALVRKLDDEHFSARASAILALESMARERNVRSVLLRKLDDRDPEVRENAVEALSSQVEKPIVRAALVKKFEDKDWGVRRSARKAFSTVAQPREVQRVLVGLLKNGDSNTREAVIEALSSSVDDAKVKAAILERLADEDPGVRMHAASTLSSSTREPKVRSGLILQLEDEDPRVRRNVVRSLSTVVKESEVQTALMSRLEDEAKWVRMEAIAALSSAVIKQGDRSTIIELIGTSDIAESITPSGVLDALIATIDGEDEKSCNQEAYSPRSVIGQDEIRKALLNRLHDSSHEVRLLAVIVLSSLLGDSEVRMTLTMRLADPNGIVRQAVLEALRSQVPEAYLQFCWKYFSVDMDQQTPSWLLGSSLVCLSPGRLKKVIQTISGNDSSELDPRIYNGLHWLRHEAKKGHCHFLDELYGCLSKENYSICFADKTTGEPLRPFFNSGTFALAVFQEVNDFVFGGKLLETEKENLVQLFRNHICNRCGFHAQSVVEEWIAPLDDSRIELNKIPTGKIDNEYVIGDRDVFRRGIVQIIGNALSFAEEKVRISLLTDPERDPAILIADDGPGIKPENVERCFTPWTSRPEKGGEGIGLSFAFPYKLGLMGFSLFVRDNEQQWHWIVSDDGRQMRPEARERNPLSNPPMNDPRLDQCLFARGAAFLIVQS